MAQDKSVDSTYVQAYYQHQYDRMAKFEAQMLQITNIVITLSIVAFTFGYDVEKPLNILNGLILPFMVVVVNLYAIGHIQRSRVWISTHRARARTIAEQYFKPLNDLSNSLPEKDMEKRYVLTRWGRRDLMILLHLTLIGVATAPVLLLYQLPLWILIVFAFVLLFLFELVIRKKRR